MVKAGIEETVIYADIGKSARECLAFHGHRLISVALEVTVCHPVSSIKWE